jgi:uncharacterized membrane protein YfhO
MRCAASDAAARVTITGTAAHRISLQVEAPRGGILVSSEVFYPGWQTRIDGAPAPTLLVDTAFRGAVVPAGTHAVEMVFVPRSFQLGLLVSLAALLATTWIWWPRRRSAAVPAGDP